MDTTMATPLGELTLRATDQGLSSCVFTSGARTNARRVRPRTRTGNANLAQVWLDRACGEFEAFFAGELTEFTVPVDLSRVDPPARQALTALDDVGYGQTTTYRGLALLAGDNEPQGAQRAGIAMARNPILIRVPCHRVLAADGSLRGYRGGLDRKRALLDLESAARQTEAGAQPAAA